MQKNRIFSLYFPLIKKFIKPFLNLFFRTKRKIDSFYSIFLIKLEIRRNNFFKKKSNKEINLIYDLSISPLTYGDTYNFLFLCRYFLINGYRVNYFLICDAEINKNIEIFDKKKLSFFYKDLENLSQNLLNHNNCSAFFCSWEQFIIKYENKLSKQITLFEKRVLKRKRIYQLSFKMLNYLLKNSSEKTKNSILLSKKFKKDYHKNINFDFKKKYITWGLRFNKRYGANRNNNEREILETYKLFEKYLPNTKIVVISDISGAKHFKKIAKKYDLSLIFAKDFSRCFLDDVIFILNSKFHFQFKGGAPGNVSWFSNTNYIIYGTPPATEKLLFTNKHHVWEKKNQVWKTIKDYTKFDRDKVEKELSNMFLKK